MKSKNIPQQHKKYFLLFFIVLLSLTIFATVALANFSTIKVDAAVVNVRTGPGLSYDVMSQVGAGDTVNVLEEKNEWYKVRLSNDRIGWVASWLVNNTEISAATNTVGTITGEKINVRSESNEQAEIIGSVVKRTELTVLFQENGWTQVQYNQQVAWVNSNFIEVKAAAVQEAPQTVATKDNSNADVQTISIRTEGTRIRTSPSTDSKVVLTASQGQSFSYIGTEGDWYHVKASDGTEGYVANWLVDLSATAEAAPTAQISSLSEATIVIDPGHGGSDPGAEGSNYYESEITLSTAEILADRLRQSGANVILTRTTDTDVGLRDRAYISNQAKADVFISIHYDSTPNPNEGSGTTTYYYSDSNKALAKAVNNGLSKGPLPNNGYRFGDHQVTRENAQPALLLEMGYVNNDTDSALITTKSYQQTMSNHIVDALTNYFNK